ncbi:MAG TPA: flagellar hook-length control protein FliK [Ignavibacteriales bacterium]|nr:flagellar hook-length control protein FliK [Ignavibacteriales bacterium]
MVFNPLFLQVVNNQEAPLLSKTQKLTGPSYLFSDIIKVQLDKNETGSMPQGSSEAASDSNLLSSIVSALSSNNAPSQIQNAAGLIAGLTAVLTPSAALQLESLNQTGTASLSEKDLPEGSDETGLEDLNSLLVGNSELINFINSLLTNQQFSGKITVAEPGSEGTLSAENLNAAQVLNLLKDGSTIEVENSAFQSNNGLLIRLVELAGSNADGADSGNTPQVKTAAPSGNAASGGVLSDMLLTQNSTQDNGGTQVSEPLYKLKFSLVNDPEVPGTLIDTQKPIIKFPFNSASSSEAGTFKLTSGMLSASKNLPSDKITPDTGLSGKAAGLTPSAADGNIPAEGSSTPDLSAGENLSLQTGSATGSNEETPAALLSDEKPQILPVSDSNDTGALTALKKEDLIKENLLKEIEVKAGKFGKIERVKTDSAVQVKDSEGALRKQEVSISKEMKNDPLMSEALKDEQKKTQKADESVNKKTAEDQVKKFADGGNLPLQKEKDLKVSSAEKQDTSQQAPGKTETKDAPKSDINSSSKDTTKDQASTEQNRKSQDTAVAGEHSEVKGKPQEEHSFNIGNLSKTNESFTSKRVSDGGIFGEAAKTVKAAEIMKEISKFIQQGDRNSIVLKIDPENLGSVKIALDLADKVVHANIEVENEAARKLMENNLNQLYNSLNQNGLQLNSINISLANSEQKQGKMPNHKRRTFTGESDKDTDDIDVLRQKQMGYNTYDYLI